MSVFPPHSEFATDTTIVQYIQDSKVYMDELLLSSLSFVLGTNKFLSVINDLSSRYFFPTLVFLLYTIQGEKDPSYAISFVNPQTYYQNFSQHVTLFEGTGKLKTDF